MAQVSTIAGLLDEAELERETIEHDRETDVMVEMVWRLKSTGEVVRRDALVNLKQGMEMQAAGGAVS